MKTVFQKVILIGSCSSIIFLTACGGSDGDSIQVTKPNKTFTVDSEVQSVVNRHDVFTYTMPSVTNKNISTEALVFTPKGTAPSTGWPVVVWAHGTTGAADQCAPSRNALTGSEKALIMALVKKGYAVIAPDYEGLGNDKEPHPYLHLKSAAQSVLFAVSEANKYYDNLSKDWSVIGWSQGGHAALAAAEFHRALVGYNFKGTVAIAPASYLAETLNLGLDVANDYAANNDLPKAVSVAATLYTYAAIVSSGIKAEYNQFDYSQAFIPEKINLAKQAESICSPQLGQQFGIDIQATLATNPKFADYKALQSNFLSDAMILNYLQVNQPAQTPIDKKVVVFQGTDDTTVPYPITQKLVASMSPQTDVELKTKLGETHSSVVANNIQELADTVDGLMKSN